MPLFPMKCTLAVCRYNAKNVPLTARLRSQWDAQAKNILPLASPSIRRVTVYYKK